MASCLGLYIEKNLIKYAKVSKEKNLKKIEAFGIKFYDKIEDGIKQVIEETYSYKTPVCINLSKETYQYFNMFSMLSKNDLDKALKTEFESYCNDKGYNPNVFEARYAVVENIEDEDKLKVLYVTNNKMDLDKEMQLLDGYRLTGIYPLPIAITNLTNKVLESNSLIVNLEEKTTITTIIKKNIYDIKVLEQGTADFLDKISLKENSYSKAYDICKDTTIYTSEAKELSSEQTGYLEDIMPILYPIVGQVQKVINESVEKIETVYITGTASLINNIDLYFQEYLEGVKCEILKPDFVGNTPNINLKDYVEVNSAISIALMGLGEGISQMNFKKEAFNEKMKNFLTTDIGKPKRGRKSKGNKFLSNLFVNDLKQPFDKVEKGLLNTAIGLLILLIVYCGFSALLKNEYKKKTDETLSSISKSEAQIASAEKDDQSIKKITSDYETRILNLEELNNRLEEKNKVKGAIPGLLNQLMNVIPSNVQITSIENTESNKVSITVKSPKYEQIAFLIGSIKTDVILNNVLSTSGQKNGDVVTVEIEGELP